jgi:muramoyltetrapeptide carboxypeptidase
MRFEGVGRLKIIKPSKLRKKATIGIVSPSSFSEPFGLGQGVNYLRSQGYKVVLGECTKNLTRTGVFAGKDEARARELMTMFSDDSIDAVICSRGGCGAMRLLQYMDFGIIKDNPKIFMGYSDITMLHIAMHQATGLVTFHGPSIEGYAGDDPERDTPTGKENIDRALRMLSTAEPWGPIANPPQGMLLRTVVPGKASGTVFGGNLSIMADTLETRYSVRTDGRILFMEDVYVSEDDVERILTHMLVAGKFSKVKGIVFGQVSSFKKREMPLPSLEEVIQDRIGILTKIPSFTGLCCGHGRIRLTIPEGVRASIDASKPTLTIDESPLKN